MKKWLHIYSIFRRNKLSIQIKKWNEVNLGVLAELTYSSIHNSGLKLNAAKSVESVENWLGGQEFSEGSFVVLSYSDAELKGWLMVVQQDTDKFAINPWGMHPFVSPNCDSKVVTSALVKHAIEAAEKRGASQIQFFVQGSREMTEEIHDAYKELYNIQGLTARGASVDMKLDLSEENVELVECPKEYQLVLSEQFDKETLYECYYNAFELEKLRFFIQQSEEERKEYFEELYSMELNSEASVAIERNGTLTGFALVIPYGEQNLHLTCICIHSDYAGKGLGRYLLSMVQRKTLEQDCKTMTLYTDQDIRAYDLYIKNGWEVTETYSEYTWSN